MVDMFMVVWWTFVCDTCIRDDHIAIKSGRGEAGIQFNRSSEHIVIEGNYFHYGGGVAIGSETSGGVNNVIVQNNRYLASFKFVWHTKPMIINRFSVLSD